MIRTSSRRVFRRCLRKWGYQSSFRDNLERQGAETNINFWFGSAIHWAMEDYFGYNKFGDPRLAFSAYYDCFAPEERPMMADEHYDLGLGMLDYFMQWLPRHNSQYGFETLWCKIDSEGKYIECLPNDPEGFPMVEQSFELDLGLRVIVKQGKIVAYFEESEGLPSGLELQYDFDQKPIYSYFGDVVTVEPVHYHGTMDRIVRDKYGRWYVLDYKTAKGADTNKLDTDDQISAYMWAAEQVFQHKVHGFVYLQLTKAVPSQPRLLKNGNLSTDKRQKTTYDLYKKAIIDMYGEVNKAPKANIDALNHFAEREDAEGDAFIRWDVVTRSDAQKMATYKHIMNEARLMCDPNLPLFPNPTRDCIWDCPFRDMCLAEDDGRQADIEIIIANNWQTRDDSDESNHEEWKEKLVYPSQEQTKQKQLALDNYIKENKETIFNIVLPAEYLDD